MYLIVLFDITMSYNLVLCHLISYQITVWYGQTQFVLLRVRFAVYQQFLSHSHSIFIIIISMETSHRQKWPLEGFRDKRWTEWLRWWWWWWEIFIKQLMMKDRQKGKRFVRLMVFDSFGFNVASDDDDDDGLVRRWRAHTHTHWVHHTSQPLWMCLTFWCWVIKS